MNDYETGIIISSSRGERGSRCEVDRCEKPGRVKVCNIIYRHYGFPTESGSDWTLEQARCHLAGLLEDGGTVEQWDEELASLIGITRPDPVQES